MNLIDNLDIPTAYLLQENTNFSSLDDFGWSLMHYAIALNKIDKIDEFVYFDIDFNINSNTKKIPSQFLFVHGKEDLTAYQNIMFINIPYCSIGYTPVHLNIFLHQYYNKRKHEDYKTHALNQSKIFTNFLHTFPDCIYWRDTKGLTATDYSLLSLNLELLMKIKNIDTDLNSLSYVQLSTAEKIFETIPNKEHDMTLEEFNFVQEMINFCKSKQMKQKLEKQLCNKEKSDIINKI